MTAVSMEGSSDPEVGSTYPGSELLVEGTEPGMEVRAEGTAEVAS